MAGPGGEEKQEPPPQRDSNFPRLQDIGNVAVPLGLAVVVAVFVALGIEDSLSPSMTTVCPAFAPPWYRTTQSAPSAITSTSLPLPSSPHWAPTTTSVRMCWSNMKRKLVGSGEKQQR